MKSGILLSWRYDWERSMWRMKGISRRYLLTRTSYEWGREAYFSDEDAEKERKQNAAKLRIEPASRVWQADTSTQPRHLVERGKNLRNRNKTWFLQGWYNESPHRIFVAAQTKDWTAPQLHRDFFSFIDITGSWRTMLERELEHRLPNSTPPRVCYYQGNVFPSPTQPGFHDLWEHLMLPFQGKGPSKSRYKIKIFREIFGYSGKERGFFARTLPLLLCVLFFIPLNLTLAIMAGRKFLSDIILRKSLTREGLRASTR